MKVPLNKRPSRPWHLLDPEAEPTAATAGVGEIAPEYLHHVNRSELRISHPVARLERVKIVRLDVGDQSLAPPGEVLPQSHGHADRVQALTAIPRVREPLVHVNVVSAEAQEQIRRVDARRRGRVPAVGGESL